MAILCHLWLIKKKKLFPCKPQLIWTKLSSSVHGDNPRPDKFTQFVNKYVILVKLRLFRFIFPFMQHWLPLIIHTLCACCFNLTSMQFVLCVKVLCGKFFIHALVTCGFNFPFVQHCLIDTLVMQHCCLIHTLFATRSLPLKFSSLIFVSERLDVGVEVAEPLALPLLGVTGIGFLSTGGAGGSTPSVSLPYFLPLQCLMDACTREEWGCT